MSKLAVYVPPGKKKLYDTHPRSGQNRSNLHAFYKCRYILHNPNRNKIPFTISGNTVIKRFIVTLLSIDQQPYGSHVEVVYL